jgi:hypothetical protein
MTAQQSRKRAIRAYFVNYTDQNLADALCFARDGGLSYYSCCCLVGLPTAAHPLKGASQYYPDCGHFLAALRLIGAEKAHDAFSELGRDDAARRRILIPMIRTEMWRRARIRELDACLEPKLAEVLG